MRVSSVKFTILAKLTEGCDPEGIGCSILLELQLTW